ncbi:ABC transporter, permease protein 2 RSc1752 [Olavius algarvensis Delta 1 endosymbiont]|nr:ABC transporter, permease protein 2 RSc1752 [Olavius algarvensis Delta 1 endosymbiont]
MTTENTKSNNTTLYLIRRCGIWVAAALLTCVLPLIFRSGFALSMMSQMGIAIIFALSYNMLLGQGGMLSFGHAVFYGLGGFISIHALNIVMDGELPVPVELMPLIGGIGGFLFGIIFGWISTKRAGTTFALISLGIGEMIAACSLMLPSFFGGEEGISGDRMLEVTLTGFGFGKQIEVYFLIGFWMLLCTALMYLQTQTPLGRVANAVRDNPERTPFIGYDIHRVRTRQYALAAFFAGIAGGLFAINYEIVTAETVGALESGNVLMMTYIGGVGHFFGPILGAVLVTFMQISLANITHAWLLYFGLLFMGMVLWAPNGLAGIIMLHEPVWKAGLTRKLMPAYAKAALPTLLLFLGVMLLIEINYHLSLSIDPDKPMDLFGIQFYAQSPIPWAISILLTIIGFLLFRRAAKLVNLSLQDITYEMKKGIR